MNLYLLALGHVLGTLALQVPMILFGVDPLLAGLIPCAFFVGRELAQAEYRWIEWFGEGRRANMPLWGGFDPRVWKLHSILGWAGPMVAAGALTLIW